MDVCLFGCCWLQYLATFLSLSKTIRVSSFKLSLHLFDFLSPHTSSYVHLFCTVYFVYIGREWTSSPRGQTIGLLGFLNILIVTHSICYEEGKKEKEKKKVEALCVCCLTREKRSFWRPSRSTGCRLRSLIPGSRLSSMDELYWIR